MHRLRFEDAANSVCALSHVEGDGLNRMGCRTCTSIWHKRMARGMAALRRATGVQKIAPKKARKAKAVPRKPGLGKARRFVAEPAGALDCQAWR